MGLPCVQNRLAFLSARPCGDGVAVQQDWTTPRCFLLRCPACTSPTHCHLTSAPTCPPPLPIQHLTQLVRCPPTISRSAIMPLHTAAVPLAAVA